MIIIKKLDGSDYDLDNMSDIELLGWCVGFLALRLLQSEKKSSNKEILNKIMMDINQQILKISLEEQCDDTTE